MYLRGLRFVRPRPAVLGEAGDTELGGEEQALHRLRQMQSSHGRPGRRASMRLAGGRIERREVAKLPDLVSQTRGRADAGGDRAGILGAHSVLDQARRDDALVEVVDGRPIDAARCGCVRLDARDEPVSGPDHRRAARRIREYRGTQVVPRDLGILVREAAGATVAPSGDATAWMSENAREEPIEQIRAARLGQATVCALSEDLWLARDDGFRQSL